MKNQERKLHGIIARFATAEELVEAARKAQTAGYRAMDAYTPYPVEGLEEALGIRRTGLPLLVLLGGITGCGLGLLLQWYSAAVDYPLNIGGRPLASWPAFIPITFELTVLFAAFAAVLGMLALNRLPRLHHPVFGAPEFERASTDGFFLCLEADNPQFEAKATGRFLESLGAIKVSEVRG